MAGPEQPGAASITSTKTSSDSAASRQQLSSWGLPQPILDAFHKKGLKQLYPWQAAPPLRGTRGSVFMP